MRNALCLSTVFAILLSTAVQADVFPSTYVSKTANPVLFTNATILTGDGGRIDNTSLYISDGRIQWMGEGVVAPDAI
ncbi:MAG: amidohydrolase, partial [Luminiphilus sp.]